MIVAALIVYFLISQGEGLIANLVACFIGFVLVVLSSFLIYILVKKSLKLLGIYNIIYAVFGLFLVAYLTVNAYHWINWPNCKHEEPQWYAPLLVTIYAGTYSFALAILCLYRSFEKTDVEL
ncbi:maker35 [Drosophila busckii]|uniref:Maker35 n=1 Tax=Drosophila busckii TaxID=30019 RepID=A0A0M3QUP6_DROBS|nr:uncharacterized protein LOC108595945 [Drosophila busckii]ALC40993.1 maker35 [Drosophila busckii]